MSLETDENRWDVNWSSADVGTFTTFDQHEFFPAETDWTDDNFNGRDNGYLYVPKFCETNECLVHFAFHGCGGSAEGMGRS